MNFRKKLFGNTVTVSFLFILLFFVFSSDLNAQSAVSQATKVTASLVSKTYFNDRSITLNSCGDLNTENALYVIKNDIYTSGTCFVISADNVRIVGNGFSLIGQGGLETFGIKSEQNSNLEIEGLKIKNFGTGVGILSGTESVTLNKVSIQNSSSISLNVYDADDITVINSEFTGNLGSEITMFTAVGKSIHATISNNTFKQNKGNAIRGIGLIADIENNLIIDNGEPTQQPLNRGIWIRSIIERPAPGHVKVPASANIRNNKLVRIGGSGIVCSAYDGNYCDIDKNFLKDIHGPAAISFGPVGSVAQNNLIMNSDNIGIDVMKRQVKDVLVKNNVIVNSKLGISVEPGLTQNQFVEDVTLEGNMILGSQNGIYLIGLRHDNKNHVIKNNIVSNSTGDAFYLKGVRLSDVIFENNSVSGTASGFLDFNMLTQGINRLTFVENNFGKYMFAGSGTSGAEFSNVNGEVTFLENLSGSGINLSEEISLEFNLATINDENNSGLDIPATVTFYNMPGGFDNPVVFKDGNVCSDCVASGNLNSKTVVFKIPGAGSYWIGDE